MSFGREDATRVTCDLNPAFVSVVCACWTGWEVTFGTVMCPLEIEMVTVWPWPSCVPGPGACAKTMFGGLLLCPVTGVDFKFASWIRCAATVDCKPITSGTLDLSLPRDSSHQMRSPATTSTSRATSHTHQ
jgi:hypothetical protein